VVTLEHRSGEVGKAGVTGLAAISLPVRLRLIMTMLDYLCAATADAMNPFGPPQVSDGLEALAVIDETFNFDKLTGRQSSHLQERSSEVEGAQDHYHVWSKKSRTVSASGDLWANRATNPESIKSHF
jgi:hypothetical protein